MTAQRARSTYTDNITPFTGVLPNGDFGQPMIRGAETLFAIFANSQRQTLDFAVMRMEKDGNLIRELTACRNWTDAFGVQSRWIQETIRDFTAQTTKLLALSANDEQPESAPQTNQ